jgi:hypothetical protein
MPLLQCEVEQEVANAVINQLPLLTAAPNSAFARAAQLAAARLYPREQKPT